MVLHEEIGLLSCGHQFCVNKQKLGLLLLVVKSEFSRVHSADMALSLYALP